MKSDDSFYNKRAELACSSCRVIYDYQQTEYNIKCMSHTQCDCRKNLEPSLAQIDSLLVSLQNLRMSVLQVAAEAKLDPDKAIKLS